MDPLTQFFQSNMILKKQQIQMNGNSGLSEKETCITSFLADQIMSKVTALSSRLFILSPKYLQYIISPDPVCVCVCACVECTAPMSSGAHLNKPTGGRHRYAGTGPEGWKVSALTLFHSMILFCVRPFMQEASGVHN